MRSRATTRQVRKSYSRRVGNTEEQAVPSGPGHGLQTRTREMDRRLQTQERLMAQLRRKLIHEGDYAAEVEVQLIEGEEGWSPYLTLEDAEKLDQVREALRRGDVKS